jgi:hypothetical protein
MAKKGQKMVKKGPFWLFFDFLIYVILAIFSTKRAQLQHSRI